MRIGGEAPIELGLAALVWPETLVLDVVPARRACPSRIGKRRMRPWALGERIRRARRHSRHQSNSLTLSIFVSFGGRAIRFFSPALPAVAERKVDAAFCRLPLREFGDAAE